MAYLQISSAIDSLSYQEPAAIRTLYAIFILPPFLQNAYIDQGVRVRSRR